MSGNHPYQFKICGLTRPIDVLASINGGADAIGFNFYPGSKRYLPVENLPSLAKLAATKAKCIAVVVDANWEQLSSIIGTGWIDGIQFHGSEEPDVVLPWLERLGSPPVWKSFVYETSRDLAKVARWVSLANTLNLQGMLVDAHDPIEHGGTGKRARWDLLQQTPPELQGVPLVLAGGLNEHNVDHAIRLVRPAAVDVASGVEISPGVKSAEKITAFLGAAKSAMQKILAP